MEIFYKLINFNFKKTCKYQTDTQAPNCWYVVSDSSVMLVNSSWPLNVDTQAGNVIKDQMFLPLTIQSNASLEYVSGKAYDF